MLTLSITNQKALRASSSQVVIQAVLCGKEKVFAVSKMMPQDMQDAINHSLETGDFTGEAYDAAVAEYMDRYCNYWLGEDVQNVS